MRSRSRSPDTERAQQKQNRVQNCKVSGRVQAGHHTTAARGEHKDCSSTDSRDECLGSALKEQHVYRLPAPREIKAWLCSSQSVQSLLSLLDCKRVAVKGVQGPGARALPSSDGQATSIVEILKDRALWRPLELLLKRASQCLADLDDPRWLCVRGGRVKDLSFGPLHMCPCARVSQHAQLFSAGDCSL